MMARVWSRLLAAAIIVVLLVACGVAEPAASGVASPTEDIPNLPSPTVTGVVATAGMTAAPLQGTEIQPSNETATQVASTATPAPTSTPTAVMTPTPVPITLPADAMLRTADEAAAAAVRLAESVLQASSPQMVSVELMTLADVLRVQEDVAGSSMLIWDATAFSMPVWLVRLEGSTFQSIDCRDCAEGDAALVTLNAWHGGAYWVAIGEPPVAEAPAAMQQVFPHVVPEPRFSAGPDAVTADEMVAAALAHLTWRQAMTEGVEAEVVLAIPVTAASLEAAGLNTISMPESCRRPFYLVVVGGEFDPSGLMPGIGRWGPPEPVSYIALVFDLGGGAPGPVTGVMTFSDPQHIQQVIDDPGRAIDPVAPLPQPRDVDADEQPGEPLDELTICHDIWL